MDFEKPCRGDDDLMLVRNCDGTGEPQIFECEEFECCPVAWLSKHPAETFIFSVWKSCLGGVLTNGMGVVNPVIHLPFDGKVTDQPHNILQAFSVLTGQVEKIIELNRKEK